MEEEEEGSGVVGMTGVAAVEVGSLMDGVIANESFCVLGVTIMCASLDLLFLSFDFVMLRLGVKIFPARPFSFLLFFFVLLF